MEIDESDDSLLPAEVLGVNGHHDTGAGGVACRTVVRKTLLDGDSDWPRLERDLSVQLLGFLLSLVELSNGLGAVLDARDGLSSLSISSVPVKEKLDSDLEP